MLKTFFFVDGFLPLPGSAGLYSLNRFGELLDANGDSLQAVFDTDGNKCYDISWIHGKRLYKIAFLLLVVFKPVRFDLKTTKLLDVDFIDNDAQNLSLDNVVWRFPITGIETEPGSGFYFIPGHTGYSINKEGAVKNNSTNYFLEGKWHSSGYRYYCIGSDVPSGSSNSKVVGRHRLIAFTFLHYPAHADKLDVNHKNGKPGDDRVDNLEWTTRKVNTMHAYSNGLRPDNKIVVVFDNRTGKETEYFSTHECEAKLGLGRSTVHYRIKKGNGKFYPPGLSFRYKNNSLSEKPKQIVVKCTNQGTNETKIFSSIIRCARELNISKKCISRRLKESNQILLKNHLIEKVTAYNC